MKVFVTGGAGFIGSWVTKVLLEEGHKVTVYDNLSRGHKDAINERVHFIEGDLANEEQLRSALQGHEAVIHMAAFIEVAESVKNPVLFAENNVVNSVKLLETMHQAGVHKIVFSSSATVYGKPKQLPITEEDPLGVAANPYGAGKAAVEFFCQAYHTMYNFDVTLLRYFNPYGPGELHEPETHAIPNFIKAALHKKPLPVYWQGEQIRDFIFIEDLARAHTAVLDQTGLQVFNVGTESGVKIKDVIRLLSEVLGQKIQIQDLGERKGDVMATYASSKRLQSATGWRVQVDLREGLKRTVAFLQSNYDTVIARYEATS